MRILTIRGENLASLADEFCVDLTQEPLRSAGLFAITGPTGSGKSTILDAMCLALYGTCPRLTTTGVDDNIIDVSGDRLKSSDPRVILRPGAITSWAEVDFEGADGRSYRARWSARRARGNAEGRLQPVERSLHDLEQDKLIENGTTLVNQSVARLSGLSYDEFRRTVLLPQGDFDAFLQANTGERAAILEKVTGTEIYRRISRAVYARAEEVRGSLGVLQTRMGEHEVLNEDERSAMVQGMEKLREEQMRLQAAIEAMQHDRQRHVEIVAAEQRLAQAEIDMEAARVSHAANADLVERLAGLEKAEPLRGAWQVLGMRVKACEVAQQRMSEAGAAAEAQKAGLESATTFATAADAQFLLREGEVRALEPKWLEAARTDEQVDAAQLHLRSETEKAGGAQKSRAEAAGSFNAIVQEIEKLELAQAEIEQNREKHAGIGIMAGEWGRLDTLLSRHGVTRNSILTAGARKEAARLRHARADAARAAEILKRESLDGRIGQFRIEHATLTARIADTGPTDPEARRDRIVDDIAALGELARLVRDIGSATQGIAQENEALTKADAARQEAEDKGNALVAEIEGARKSLALLEAPAARAEAALSSSAAHLRAHLQDGAPCPVCQSTTHPVQGNAEMKAMADELRLALETGRARILGLERDAESRRVAYSEAAAGARRSKAEIARRQLLLDEALASYASRVERFTSLPIDAAQSAQHISDLLATSMIEKGQLDATIAVLRKDRVEAERLQKLAQDLGAERETAIAGIAMHDLECAAAQSELSHAGEAESSGCAELEKLDAEILPIVQPIGMKAESLARDGLAAKLGKLKDWWAELQAKEQAGRNRLSELNPRMAAARETLRAADERHLEANRSASTAEERLVELQRTRAGMLGGEATETHRAVWQARLDDDRKQAEQAGRDLALMREAQAKASERLSGAREEMEAAGKALASAEAELNSGLGSAGISREVMSEAMKEDPGFAARLREKIASADRALEGARTRLDGRSADLAAVLEKGVPAMTAEDLQEQIKQAQLDQKAHGEEIGALYAKLNADAQLREKLSGIEAELAMARGNCETWDAVNAAVGQANGNRFAQFAQSVTLGVLIERANIQMHNLRPRYRLDHGGEDLSIQVIDDEMGGERRSANSLSGGERFLVSLSLALGLAGMGGNGGLAGTLFIDEGFGTLDAESLDIALEALERLQSQGRSVGIISHVSAMNERIPVKVMVRKRGSGRSTVTTAAI
ncbi:AAA family ATPase [Paracoccus litorisediminis]|uniref:AAA family ATPase n=1 Tax=Paracoccus litorisediminis TaxID=2006130 RepID=UPI00372E9E66